MLWVCRMRDVVCVVGFSGCFLYDKNVISG